jgi:hypothetical protein
MIGSSDDFARFPDRAPKSWTRSARPVLSENHIHVSVMQSTKDQDGDNVADPLDRSPQRRILLE